MCCWPCIGLAVVCQCIVLRSSDLDTGLQAQSDKCQIERNSCLPWPPGCCLPATAQDVVGHLRHKGTVQSAVHSCSPPVFGSCCPPRLPAAFLENCSCLSCPPACPIVWGSLIWRAWSVAVSLVFNWFCTQLMAHYPVYISPPETWGYCVEMSQKPC